MTQRSYSIHGQNFVAPPLPGGLYVVSTPIGHLADITIRALETLAAATVVLAEDTRTTGVLLRHYAIRTAATAYTEHNAERREAALIERLAAGEALALVSDAGTPLLSDPGQRLVSAAIAAGLPVVPIPGPSALLAAMVGAGVAGEGLRFVGFLPQKTDERRRRLHDLRNDAAPLVIYEAPHRLAAMLADAAAILGPRQGVVARELTKRHETFARGTLADLAALYGEREEPRGEIVVVIAPAPSEEADDPEALDAAIVAALGEHSVRHAAQIVAARLGLPKRVVYARALVIAARDGRA